MLSAFVLQVFRVSSQHHPLGHERKLVLGHAIGGHPIAGSRGHGSGDIDLPERLNEAFGRAHGASRTCAVLELAMPENGFSASLVASTFRRFREVRPPFDDYGPVVDT